MANETPYRLDEIELREEDQRRQARDDEMRKRFSAQKESDRRWRPVLTIAAVFGVALTGAAIMKDSQRIARIGDDPEETLQRARYDFGTKSCRRGAESLVVAGLGILYRRDQRTVSVEEFNRLNALYKAVAKLGKERCPDQFTTHDRFCF